MGRSRFRTTEVSTRRADIATLDFRHQDTRVLHHTKVYFHQVKGRGDGGHLSGLLGHRPSGGTGHYWCDRGPCGRGVEMPAERSPHWTSWSRSRPGIVVDVTCNASGADHADRVSDSICEVAGNHDRQGQRPDVAASSSMEHPGSRSHQGRHEGGCRRHRGNESATERPTCFRWAGWESVQAAWRLHARLFPAVAGKGDLSGLGHAPRAICRPGARQASSTSTGWLVPWPDSAPTRTAPPPVISTSRQPRVALTGFIVRAIECGAVEQVAITGATGLDRASWTCWPVGRLRDLPDRAPIDTPPPEWPPHLGAEFTNERHRGRGVLPAPAQPVAGHRPEWESGPPLESPRHRRPGATSDRPRRTNRPSDKTDSSNY
jgi:hypothetical protein